MALFRATIIRQSIYLFKFPFCNNAQVIFFAMSLVCYWKYPYCYFSYHFCFQILSIFAVLLSLLLATVI